AFSCAAVQSGYRWARIAAAPETCGVAIEVPFARVYHASTAVPIVVPAARAATMPTPGAAMSGFSARSPQRGPRLEKFAGRSVLSVAATVRAASAGPGELTVRSPLPRLPAATTTSAPVAAVNSLTAWLSGSVPSVGWPPMLNETMSAPICRVAHSIPAIIDENGQLPASVQTRPLINVAPGATPMWRPSEAAPLPAMVEIGRAHV